MTKKIIIGGVVAGFLLFLWSFIAHAVLPTATLGVKTTQNEDAILSFLKSNLQEDGFYFLPGHEMMNSGSQSKEQQAAAKESTERKYRAGPRAFMVYHPDGAEPMEPRQLIVEFLADVVAGLILAFVLSLTLTKVRSFGGRVGIVTLLGFLPFFIVDVSYWNWFGFPVSYEMSQLIDQIPAAILAGVGLAFVFRKEPAA